jgi:hypothetical protein
MSEPKQQIAVNGASLLASLPLETLEDVFLALFRTRSGRAVSEYRLMRDAMGHALRLSHTCSRLRSIFGNVMRQLENPRCVRENVVQVRNRIVRSSVAMVRSWIHGIKRDLPPPLQAPTIQPFMRDVFSTYSILELCLSGIDLRHMGSTLFLGDRNYDVRIYRCLFASDRITVYSACSVFRLWCRGSHQHAPIAGGGGGTETADVIFTFVDADSVFDNRVKCPPMGITCTSAGRTLVSRGRLCMGITEDARVKPGETVMLSEMTPGKPYATKCDIQNLTFNASCLTEGALSSIPVRLAHSIKLIRVCEAGSATFGEARTGRRSDVVEAYDFSFASDNVQIDTIDIQVDASEGVFSAGAAFLHAARSNLSPQTTIRISLDGPPLAPLPIFPEMNDVSVYIDAYANKLRLGRRVTEQDAHDIYSRSLDFSAIQGQRRPNMNVRLSGVVASLNTICMLKRLCGKLSVEIYEDDERLYLDRDFTCAVSCYLGI